MSLRKKPKKVKPNANKFFLWLGLVLLIISGCFFITTFGPVIQAETNYQLQPLKTVQPLVPVNTTFSIQIPKLQINAPIIANVDWQNSNVYQEALSRGIAHARGSSFPSQLGNVFLFAHSAKNWLEANRFNAVFYLTSKLNPEDEIQLYYQGKPYQYRVISKSIVSPEDVSSLNHSPKDQSILTLMTCWPPGTTYKRLIIKATLSGKL